MCAWIISTNNDDMISLDLKSDAIFQLHENGSNWVQFYYQIRAFFNER